MLNIQLRLSTRTPLFQKANLSPRERKGLSKVTLGLEPRAAPFTP